MLYTMGPLSSTDINIKNMKKNLFFFINWLDLSPGSLFHKLLIQFYITVYYWSKHSFMLCIEYKIFRMRDELEYKKSLTCIVNRKKNWLIFVLTKLPTVHNWSIVIRTNQFIRKRAQFILIFLNFLLFFFRNNIPPGNI